MAQGSASNGISQPVYLTDINGLAAGAAGCMPSMMHDAQCKAVLDQILIEMKIVNARLNAGIKVQTLGVGVTVPAVVTI